MKSNEFKKIITGAVAAVGLIGISAAGFAADRALIPSDTRASQTVSARELAAQGAVPSHAVRAGSVRVVTATSSGRTFPSVVLGQSGYTIASTQSGRTLPSNGEGVLSNGQIAQLANSGNGAVDLLPMANGFVGTPDLAAQAGINSTTQSAVIFGNQTITAGGLAPASPVFPLEPSIIGNTSTGGVAGPAVTPSVTNRNLVSTTTSTTAGATFQAGTGETGLTSPVVTAGPTTSGSITIRSVGVAGPVTVGKQ